jgi:hypothetical protein
MYKHKIRLLYELKLYMCHVMKLIHVRAELSCVPKLIRVSAEAVCWSWYMSLYTYTYPALYKLKLCAEAITLRAESCALKLLRVQWVLAWSERHARRSSSPRGGVRSRSAPINRGPRTELVGWKGCRRVTALSDTLSQQYTTIQYNSQ